MSVRQTQTDSAATVGLTDTQLRASNVNVALNGTTATAATADAVAGTAIMERGLALLNPAGSFDRAKGVGGALLVSAGSYNANLASVAALNGDLLASMDVSAYEGGSFQLSGTFVGTVMAQVSNDAGTTWTTITTVSSAANSAPTVNGALVSGNLYTFACPAKLLRIRCTAYTSGTITGAVFLTGETPLSVGVPTAGTLLVNPSALSTVVGLLIAKINSAATTNATSVKATSGRVYGYELSNTAATWRYVRLYNKASAPTVGTDSPAQIIAIPPGGRVMIENAIPIAYGTGIAYAITSGATDLDSTALLAANEVIGSIHYF